jgi:hypothetical protein
MGPDRTNRPQVRQREVAAKYLQHVPARRAARQRDGKAQAALHHAHLARRDVHAPKLRGHPQRAWPRRTGAALSMGLAGFHFHVTCMQGHRACMDTDLNEPSSQTSDQPWCAPCCGTISRSPSALPRQQASMDALAV